MAEQTLEQKRATHALAQINKIKGEYCGHYVSYVSALPATIVMNGLGQALATLLAAAGRKKDPEDDPHKWLYNHVAEWLSSGQVKALEGDKAGLIQRLMDNDQDVYLQAQGEAMAYLQWLKQFARAYITEPEGQE